jgi:general secretion pathway protein C
MNLNSSFLVNTALLAAIAGVGTYWYLQWASVRAPREQLVAVPAGDRVARSTPLDTTSVARLFGPAQTTTSTRLRLVGVIAEGGQGRGVALLSLDGQAPLAFRAGEAIDASSTLAEVGRDRVVVRSAAGIQEILMPERPPPTGIVPAR